MMGAALSVAATSPAAAQDLSQQEAYCVNKPKIHSADLQIGGCTALIRSGAYDSANLAIIFSNRGLAYHHQKDYPRAIADCSEAIRINAQDADAFYNRAKIALVQNRFQDSWNDFDAVLRLRPGIAEGLYGRDLAAQKLGRVGDGAKDMAAAVAKDANVREKFADMP